MTNACALSQPTLVLNRSWYAIATTTVRRALCLLYNEAAQAIRPETYELHGFESWADLAVRPDAPCVHTVRLRIRVPEVVVLTQYDRVPRKSMPFTRRGLFRRDASTCQYCGAQPGTSWLTIDHVLPRSRGGRSSWTNCVLACVQCNRRKSNRTPAETGMRLRREPNAPRWTQMLEIPIGRIPQSWEKFVSERYWDVPIET